MNKKPLIGVTPLYDSAKDSFWMLPGYMRAIEAAGGAPFMLPLTADKEIIMQMAKLCDGFLFTGGQDVDPALYGEQKHERCGEICELRDTLESVLMTAALDSDKPVLGICRGLQFINVFLGGTLWQDLPTEYDSDTAHSMTPPYDRVVHEVDVHGGTLLADIIGAGRIGVNSCHHQAIKQLSPQLVEAARSTDGLVEAFCMPGKKFVAAVQWHPEAMYKKYEHSAKLFEAFVMSAK